MGVSYLLLCGLPKNQKREPGNTWMLRIRGLYYLLLVLPLFFYLGIFTLTGKKIMRYVTSPDAGSRSFKHVEVYTGKIISHVFQFVTIGLIHSWIKKKKVHWLYKMITIGCLWSGQTADILCYIYQTKFLRSFTVCPITSF